MRNLVLSVLLSCCAFFVCHADTSCDPDARDVVYDRNLPQFCRGDVYLPAGSVSNAPVAVLIHGGGWGSGSPGSVRGIAGFLKSAGYVVFNIRYRLSGQAAWPACGDDCVNACRFVLSRGLSDRFGVNPERITVIGGSAGGHLALWAGLTLGPRVSKIVSISGIADPYSTVHLHRGMYRGLLRADPTPERLASIDPTKLLGSGSPEILCTHAKDDRVVAFASSAVFADACRKKGVRCRLYAYDSGTAETTGGHFIWRKGTADPRRLVGHLEREIAEFLGGPRRVK